MKTPHRNSESTATGPLRAAATRRRLDPAERLEALRKAESALAGELDALEELLRSLDMGLAGGIAPPHRAGLKRFALRRYVEKRRESRRLRADIRELEAALAEPELGEAAPPTRAS